MRLAELDLNDRKTNDLWAIWIIIDEAWKLQNMILKDDDSLFSKERKLRPLEIKANFNGTFTIILHHVKFTYEKVYLAGKTKFKVGSSKQDVGVDLSLLSTSDHELLRYTADKIYEIILTQKSRPWYKFW